MTRPLLATCDRDVTDDLLRLAAAAGVTLEVVHEVAEVVRRWGSAPLILIGADLVHALASHAPPRRDGVVLVTTADPDYRAALEVGVCEVAALPGAEARLADALADTLDGGGREAPVIGFIAGAGGAGATSMACATALVAARERRVTLVDLDPLGPGLERILDVSGGLTWPDLAGAEGRFGARAFLDGLPQRDGVALLGWGSAPTQTDVAWQHALPAARRGSDLVVLDLPRAGTPGDLAAACDHIVVVSPGTVMGAAATVRLVGSQLARARSLLLVVRDGALSGGDLGMALGLPVTAVLGWERRLQEHIELGLGPIAARRSALAAAAHQVLAVAA